MHWTVQQIMYLRKQAKASFCSATCTSAETKAILEECKTCYPQLSKAEWMQYQPIIGHAAEDWRRYVTDVVVHR